MKFKLDGRELEAEHIRVGELCEAEKALQINMADGSGAAIAVTLFVALRRDDPKKPAHLIADEVMRADVSTFEEAEDESPPDEAADAADNGTEPHTPVSLPTSGPPSLGRTA